MKNNDSHILFGGHMLKIKGVVVPRTWDENGRVITVTVLTHDEDEYLIENKGRGKELKAFIQQDVEVLGTLKPRDGIKVIQVKRFKLNKEPEKETDSSLSLFTRDDV